MQEDSSNPHKEPPMSPADLADEADETQNYNNPKATTTTTCLSLRNNAACCIPLRDLRNQRENNTQEYAINPHKEIPMYPADYADLR